MTFCGQMSKTSDMDMDRDLLIREARDYCAKAGIPLSTLGVRALDNRHFFDRLERRAEQEATMFRRLREFIAANPPASDPLDAERTTDHSHAHGTASVQ